MPVLSADDKPSTIKSKCIFKEIKYYLPLYHLFGTMTAAILLILLQKRDLMENCILVYII